MVAVEGSKGGGVTMGVGVVILQPTIWPRRRVKAPAARIVLDWRVW